MEPTARKCSGPLSKRTFRVVCSCPQLPAAPFEVRAIQKKSKRVHNWRVSLSLSGSLSQGSETPFSQHVLVVASGVLLFLKFSVPFRAVPPVLFLQRSSSKPHSPFRAVCLCFSSALSPLARFVPDALQFLRSFPQIPFGRFAPCFVNYL